MPARQVVWSNRRGVSTRNWVIGNGGVQPIIGQGVGMSPHFAVVNAAEQPEGVSRRHDTGRFPNHGRLRVSHDRMGSASAAEVRHRGSLPAVRGSAFRHSVSMPDLPFAPPPGAYRHILLPVQSQESCRWVISLNSRGLEPSRNAGCAAPGPWRDGPASAWRPASSRAPADRCSSPVPAAGNRWRRVGPGCR